MAKQPKPTFSFARAAHGSAASDGTFPRNPSAVTIKKPYVPKTPKSFQVNANTRLTHEQHDALAKHVKERLDFSQTVRKRVVEKLRYIDKELHGFMVLDPEDRKREQDNQLGMGPKTTDIKPLFGMTQIEDAVTYCVELFNGEEGLYNAVSTKDRQQFANGFTKSMNEDADYFKHVDQLILGVRSMMKYNLGGWLTDWRRVHGNVMERDNASGGITLRRDVVKDGNQICAFDMYNYLWDISVPFDEVNAKGEFFAVVEPVRAFTIQRLHDNGEIFGDVDYVVSTTRDTVHEYMERKPDVNFDRYNSVVTGDKVDWESVWGIGTGDVPREVSDAYEFVWYYGWIRPADFGLSKSKNLEIWRLLWVNQSIFMFAQQLDNAHGLLPTATCMPIKDELTHQTRSYAERLIGLDRFAGNEFNVHQRAARKALYGVTMYNQRTMPLMEHADILAGKVPYNPVSDQYDIRRDVAQFTDTPDTNQTMQNVSATLEMMQHLLPTNIRTPVTSLDRAVNMQVAAIINDTNKRAHLIATVINIQALVPMRSIQMYNIFQYRGIIEVIDEQGNLIEYPVSDALDAKIIFEIGLGLKGVDRLYVQESLKEITNALLQSKAGQQQINLVEFLNYYTSLIGDKTDLRQFQYKHPIDSLSPEEKTTALQLLQQASQGQQGTVTALSDFSPAQGAAE